MHIRKSRCVLNLREHVNWRATLSHEGKHQPSLCHYRISSTKRSVSVSLRFKTQNNVLLIVAPTSRVTRSSHWHLRTGISRLKYIVIEHARSHDDLVSERSFGSYCFVRQRVNKRLSATEVSLNHVTLRTLLWSKWPSGELPKGSGSKHAPTRILCYCASYGAFSLLKE